MQSFPKPIHLSLLFFLFEFLPSASTFSFLAIQERHPFPRKQYLQPQREHCRLATIERSSSKLFSVLGSDSENEIDHYNDIGETNYDDKASQTRRRMMSSIVAGVLTSGVVNRHLKRSFAFASNANAAMIEDASILGTFEKPVVIVGGSGRTGMAVAEAVADPGFGNMHAVTLSRSGRDPFQIVKLPKATKDHLKHKDEPFDVRDSQAAISASLKALSPSVVVYAASASRQGGNSFEVDDAGVEKVAQACKEIGAIFVLISALAVDRPESKSFQITNTLGGV